MVESGLKLGHSGRETFAARNNSQFAKATAWPIGTVIAGLVASMRLKRSASDRSSGAGFIDGSRRERNRGKATKLW